MGMDKLDVLIADGEGVPGRGADPVRELVSGCDLGAVEEAVRARPEPWFFAAGPCLTVFATRGSPGSGSAPHDHGLWAVIACLAGREGSRRYEVIDYKLVETGLRPAVGTRYCEAPSHIRRPGFPGRYTPSTPRPGRFLQIAASNMAVHVEISCSSSTAGRSHPRTWGIKREASRAPRASWVRP